MTPSFLALLITILVLNFLMGLSEECTEIIIEPQEKFYSSKLNLLLIESETEELVQTNINLISESLRIQSFVDEHIISTLTIQYFSFRSIEDQLFCKFIKTETYVITCIKIRDYYANDRLNYLNEQSIILIELNELKGIECHDFFINSESKFILICFRNFHLEIYCIDQDNKIYLLSQHLINQQQYEMCKRKYIKFDDNYYIISFYQCKYWGLYIYQQQEIQELVNEELVKPLQISYLENAYFCQHRLFLVSEFGYYQFYITKMRYAQFSMFFEFPAQFRSLLFSSNCFFSYYVQFNQSSNQTIIFQNEQKFISSFEGTDVQIELMESILFAKTQNQLKVMYNQEYQQIIQLNTSHITFDNHYNLIYWLDEITKELIFYKISYPKNFIKPSQKYIFQVNNYYLQKSQTKICFKMKYIMEKKYNQKQTLDLNYQCQNLSSLFYSKEGLQLPNKYEIKFDQNLEFGLNILDQYSFKFLCPKPYNFNSQDTILLYYEANTNISFSMIQTKYYIYFQDCHNATKSQVDIQNCQIFYDQSNLLLYNQNKQELKLIGFQGKLTKKFKIQNQITGILQCQQILLIFTSDGQDPKFIDLSKHYQIFLNQQSNKILNTIHQIYLQDKQKNQNLKPGHFFMESENPKLIQYNQYLIIQIYKQMKIFRLENIQIVYFKEKLTQYYQFLGVHLINNQIISYYFDLVEVSEMYSFNLDDYELIKPLKYQINTKYFALASLSQNKTSVLIFEIRITKPLLLVKVIQISRIEFFFQGYQLFYYNFEDEIKIYNFGYFEVQLQNPIQHNEIVVNTSITFQIISEMKSDPAINLGFTLKGYNECYQLFQKSNHSFIDSTQKQIIPSNYFYGSIDLLKIEGSEETNIIGPLIFIERIYDKSRIIKISTGPILNNNQNSIKYCSISIVLADNDFGQIFIINPDLSFAGVLPISKQQILILFFMGQINSLRGAIFLIDEYTQIFRQEPILQINITLNQSPKEYHIFKTGDLIVFKSQSHLLLYMIMNSSIKFIENDLNILEILKVYGNNQFYISYSQQRARQDYKFHVFSINEFNLVSIGTAILQIETVFIEFQDYVQNLLYYSINETNQISLLECEIIDKDFRIMALQIFSQIQIISQISINMENYSISFKIHKILRHGLGNHMKLQFYNKNSLILKSHSNSSYFYDLKEPLNFIDYFGRINQNIDLYYPFNTTHLYIFQVNTSQIYLGELGYKFDTQSQHLANQTFTLVAENQVSQARCSITIIDISYQQEQNQFLIKLLIFFGLSLVFYFILRRIKLKRKQQNNQRHNQILANTSKIEQ